MSDTGWVSLGPDDDLVVMARQCMMEFTSPGQRATLLGGLELQESASNLAFVKLFGPSDLAGLDDMPENFALDNDE